MTCSCHCAATAKEFDRRQALRDRARYERRGPDTTTRLLLEELQPVMRTGDTLLDIGGGIGVIELELNRSNDLGEAVLVDASPASAEVARGLRARNGQPARFRTIVGDVTEISPPLTAQVVTLDRVVCCYPDYTSLLRTAATSAIRVLALSYPKDKWYVHAYVGAANLARR